MALGLSFMYSNENLDMASHSIETHIQDFISGGRVRITPEEVHAFQAFAQILVNDYR